jgi:hypothetical protein
MEGVFLSAYAAARAVIEREKSINNCGHRPPALFKLCIPSAAGPPVVAPTVSGAPINTSLSRVGCLSHMGLFGQRLRNGRGGGRRRSRDRDHGDSGNGEDELAELHFEY